MISLNLDLPPFSEIIRERNLRAAREERASHKRSFLAGKRNRLNHGWPTRQTSPQSDLYQGLRGMRARMRWLAKNSDYFKKFLSDYRNNVAGPYGMTLQMTGGSDAQNQEIEKKFKEWSHKEFASVSQRLTFAQVLRRACTALARDGEVLIREIYGKNKFGYSLKFYDVAWLDETYNDTRPNGNRIVMSVEIDEDERAVAYWLTPPVGDVVAFRNRDRKRTRIPAEEIYHLFLPDDECSADDTVTRGVPPGHTAANSLFRLEQADEANLVSLQAGASKMGFYEKAVTDDEDSSDDEKADLEKSDKPVRKPISHFSPGIIEELEEGVTFKPFDPGFPNQAHEPFAKYMLRRICAGLDTIYHAMTGDLTAVNLSSMRGATVEQRELYKAQQEFFAEHLCRRVVINWLFSSVLSGEIKTVRPRELQLFNEPTFQPRRWPWPDPLKDVQTERLAIEAGLTTLTDSLGERGENLRETLTKRKTELDLANQLGVPLATGAGTLAPGTLDAQGEVTQTNEKGK